MNALHHPIEARSTPDHPRAPWPISARGARRERAMNGDHGPVTAGGVSNLVVDCARRGEFPKMLAARADPT